MVPAPPGDHAGAMTTTPPPTDPDAAPEAERGPRVTAEEVRDLGRLRRSTTDRKVAGVAGGLARHLDIDPVLLRVGFVVLAFFGGAGLILYAAGWALIPEDDRDRAPLHLDERSRTVALVAILVLAGLAMVGDSFGGNWFPWPLAVIGLIAFVWLSRSRSRDALPAEQPPEAGVGFAATAEERAGSPTTYRQLPRDPRKRGPVLFGFTVLLIAVAEGLLISIDLAGADVVGSAYPALAVGIIALALVLGAFAGRAGGLIALGVVGSVVLAFATVADRWEGESYEYRPTTAAQVEDAYVMGHGSLLVDLTGVGDVEQLDGRTIEVTGDVGDIVVLVPEDMDVRTSVEISGPGGYDLFDRVTGGGFGSSSAAQHDGGDDAPTLVVDAALEMGQITVETE